jgi:hypothetical protein
LSAQLQRPFSRASTRRQGSGASAAPAQALWLPRNAQAIIDGRASGKIQPRASLVVSFDGWTEFAAPHVFVDGGRRYDWRFSEGLHCCIVAKAGTDARAVLEDLKDLAPLGQAPYLIDFSGQFMATVVCTRPLTLMPEPKGSFLWRQCFS